MGSLAQVRREEVDEHACRRDVLGVVDDELDIFWVLAWWVADSSVQSGQ